MTEHSTSSKKVFEYSVHIGLPKGVASVKKNLTSKASLEIIPCGELNSVDLAQRSLAPFGTDGAIKHVYDLQRPRLQKVVASCSTQYYVGITQVLGLTSCRNSLPYPCLDTGQLYLQSNYWHFPKPLTWNALGGAVTGLLASTRDWEPRWPGLSNVASRTFSGPAIS